MLTAFTFRTNNLHWLKSEPGYTTQICQSLDWRVVTAPTPTHKSVYKTHH